LVATERNGDAVQIVVEDAGPGFPPDLLFNAFEPFERGGDDGGTGLGLAIVSVVAQTHSGRTSATNLSSGGSRVLLEFPDVGATGQEAGKAGTTNNP
jgi:signal transduction histidine kinase